MADTNRPGVLDTQLATHPFVRGLDESHIAAMRAFAELAVFAPGDVIFLAGDEAKRFYLIRTGLVKLRSRGDRGQVSDIQTIREGSVLGWSWLFSPYTWEFDAVAETPVRGVAIDAVGLRESFEENHELAHRILMRVSAAMAKRLHAVRREIDVLSGA